MTPQQVEEGRKLVNRIELTHGVINALEFGEAGTICMVIEDNPDLGVKVGEILLPKYRAQLEDLQQQLAEL
jgi:hypothetical protein